MKTNTIIKPLALFCFIFLFTSVQAQNIGGILKRKTEKVVDQTLDQGIDELTKKEKRKARKAKKKESESAPVSVVNTNNEASALTDFIAPNQLIFSDTFNKEKPSEFPSRWTLLKGTLQNAQVIVSGQKEGVIEFRTSSSLKPTIKNDNYLGDSFKMEIQCYFHEKGNESYTLNLMNNKDVYGAYQITIRGDGIVPAGSSQSYARFPKALPAGWRTVQLSFNKGILKVFYEGYQLINIPKLNKGEDRILTEFTHLEVSALSNKINKAMINHVAIASNGLPLYDRLIQSGRLIIQNINFDVNSYVIQPNSYPILDEIITMFQEHPELEIMIAGHTDSDGSDGDNMTLSENRAKAVMKYMVSKGIKNYRLSSKGYGEFKPLVEGNSASAKAQNRRVEFVLIK